VTQVLCCYPGEPAWRDFGTVEGVLTTGDLYVEFFNGGARALEERKGGGRGSILLVRGGIWIRILRHNLCKVRQRSCAQGNLLHHELLHICSTREQVRFQSLHSQLP